MVWSDININLELGRDGDIKKHTYYSAVENSITNIIETLIFQRRMLPDFANSLPYLLMEPMTDETAREIGETIIDAINIWEPRVIIEDIDVNTFIDKLQYDILLRYRIEPEGEIRTYQKILQQR